MSSITTTPRRTDRPRRSGDSVEIAYRTARGDDVLQDKIFTHETVQMILRRLERIGGRLAYSPEVVHRVSTELQQRYETDVGNDIFIPPNYAPYEDPNLAAFYGVDTSQIDNIQTRKETFEETRHRLIEEVTRQIEVELPGLQTMMNHYEQENWARHGISDEMPFIHQDPDVTLFRNPERQWASIDRPVSTNDKGNVINLYDAEPDYTFPQPHPGWTVDKRTGFWSELN
jgi:hypothetical protein